ncbi:MAG TPA: glycosyltransferase family 39 protein [Burkholderiales bacterium]|nr:glycosyltransferase family 39 protein [Burkholderiales bacterium]
MSATPLAATPESVLTAPPAGRRAIWLALALVLLALWFVKLPERPLAHPDEGRYAEISREMVASGDWVTPRLNGFAYLQKPPLQYWATAVAYEAFGVSEWTARLWTALTGLAAVFVAWFAGRRLLGTAAGDFGALALLASPYFIVMSGVNTLDMGVSLFLSGAVFAYLLSQQAATGAAERGWMLVAWAAMAAAVLSKGLIGVVLPFGTLLGYAIWHRQPAAFARLHLLPGLVLLVAITAPWFVLAARANPEFLEFFFLHEHFQRFTTTVHNRAGPVWYFVPILLIAVAPWVVAAGDGVVRAWRSRPEGGAVSARRFLLVWCAVVFGFFSVSQSKLPAYLLPLVPALALLAGDALANGNGRRSAFALAVGAMVFGAVTFTANEVFEGRNLGVLHSIYEAFSVWTESGSMLLVIAAGIGLYWIDRTEPRRLIVALLAAFYVSMSLGMVGYGQLAPIRSAASFAGQINRLGPRDAPVYAVRMYDQTLPFYLGRLVTVVEFTGELEPGIRADPQRQVSTLEAFRARWHADPAAFAIMPPDTFETLRREGFPASLVAEDAKKVLVRKPPG